MSTSNDSWLSKLRSGLKKTGQSLGADIRAVFSKTTAASFSLSPEQLENIQDLLIQSDISANTAHEISNLLKKAPIANREDALLHLVKIFSESLTPYARPFSVPDHPSTQVILVSGVNGSGKTTTIAKLTKQCLEANQSVQWAACDTFRAAATEQMQIWSHRLGVPLYKSSKQADPASVAFQALTEAKKTNAKILFIDTAGRLHNNGSLMQELAKIVRVLKKIDPTAPHQSFLVLDGTTGQNTFSQVEHFSQFIPITGLIVTKLDGTAKAGFILELCKKTNLPIVAVGVGENVDDLNKLDCQTFSEALVGLKIK